MLTNPSFSLSKTSSMPNPSWSQTAGPSYCGAYRGGKRSVCKSCYAGKGRFTFPNVRGANERRYEWFHSAPREVVVHTLAGEYAGQRLARAFVSGDFCHPPCVHVWRDVVKTTGAGTSWWFPTRVWLKEEYHQPLMDLNALPNVVVRLSNEKVDEPVPEEVREKLGISTVSTVYEDKKYSCPKQVSHTNCTNAGCERCWDGNVKETTYLLTGGEVNWKRKRNE